jgi:exodeoxyribonuclease VII small subunit
MAGKKSESDKKEEKFEDALERLQGLVRELEGGDCALEDSIKKFEEGMALARSCQERLTQAEQKIEILLKADQNGVRTETFADGEE